MRILVINAGTSSLKLSVIDPGDHTVAERELGPSDASAAGSIEQFAREHGRIDAAGHRLVHGGATLRTAVVVDSRVRTTLASVVELAPLHMPPALRLLDALQQQMDVPQVACFDTAFHANLPAKAFTYALPQRWRSMGVRRFGFHGLSCAWALRRAALLLERSPDAMQLVVAHLGSGASVTAIRDGHSVDTSMGFTPLDGLVMATRSGRVDPGALTWLQTARGVSAEAVFEGLEQDSGLLALAGAADMQEVERRALAGEADAALAIDVYVHRACAEIASVAASLDRLDALVFTGGVGEHSGEIRESICAGLRVLGLPRTISARGEDDGFLSHARVQPAVLVIHAREDLEVAREVRGVLG